MLYTKFNFLLSFPARSGSPDPRGSQIYCPDDPGRCGHSTPGAAFTTALATTHILSSLIIVFEMFLRVPSDGPPFFADLLLTFVSNDVLTQHITPA
jgi:hypothetical protein